MAIGGNFHYLIQSTYRPRIFAYGIAVMLLGIKMYYTGLSVPYLFFLIFLLAHPHLNHYFFGLLKNSSRGARISLLVDAWLIGLMIVMAEFNALASLAFVSGLVMGTLMIAKPGYLVLNLASLIMSVCLWNFLLMPNVDLEGRLVTNLLSSALIVGFGGLVASLGFVETSDLENKRRATNRKMNVLQGTFDRLRPYVSSQLVSSIESADSIATSRKRISVFFSDIEGFTSMMDNLPEAIMTRILNDYLNEMAEVAISYGGTVDKFIGDGVMVLFGAPESKGAVKDAICCVQMAIAMRLRLEYLRAKWSSGALPTNLHIRIGIHSGYSAVGNFGSKQRMDYTAIGGVVNLASRLEKAAGTDEILVSAETWALVEGDIHGEIRRPIRVKGIEGEIPVVAILDPMRSGTALAPPGLQLINRSP